MCRMSKISQLWEHFFGFIRYFTFNNNTISCNWHHQFCQMEAVKSSRFTLVSEFIFLQIYLSKPFGNLRVWFICIAGLFMFVHKDTWISPFTAAVGKVLPDGERNDYGGERRVALGWSLGALTTPARRVLTNQRRDFEKKRKKSPRTRSVLPLSTTSLGSHGSKIRPTINVAGNCSENP